MSAQRNASTVHGGMDEEHGDVYDRKAVEEARVYKNRWRRTGR